nr:DUF4062 domain-containing protein [Caulobacter sp. 17J65-9]
MSSTIYDFRDLRSGIKFFLEEQGCRVLASEFNDFSKSLDTHSYEACLQSIQQADYFVLLIGNRVGGWYNENDRTSITQQEYRAAYNLQNAGKLKIASFVRADVWQFKEDYKSLAKHLKSAPIDASTRAAIAKYPNKTVDDAEFIVRFIDEVGKNEETTSARRGEGDFPTGNWIHVFTEFGEVIDVLRALVFNGTPADEAVFRAALRRELADLLSVSLVKVRDGVVSPRPYVESFNAAYRITDATRRRTFHGVPAKDWDALTSLLMHWINRTLRVNVLIEALSHSAFMEFDRVQGLCRETPAFRAILRLAEEVRALNAAASEEALAPIFKYSPKARLNPEADLVTVEVHELASLLQLAFRWVNVVELSSALLAYLEGEQLIEPDLLPRSPVADFDRKLEKERVTPEEALKYAVARAVSPQSGGNN